MKDTVNVDEAMHLLCVSRRTVYHYMQRGTLEVSSTGHGQRISRSSIDRLLSTLRRRPWWRGHEHPAGKGSA